MRAAGAVALALVLLTGCTIGARPDDGSKENSVSTQVEQTHRFDVDLSGQMPTREQLGLASGQTQRTYTGDPSTPVQVTYRLGSGSFTVPASMVTVSTTSQYVTTARSPEADDALMPPNEVAATQPFATSDEAKDLVLAQADLLGLDRADIDRWFATAPAGPGPNVVLAKHFFAGAQRIGYVDVSVGVFVSDLAYVIWDLSWDPPIPGYTYGPNGIPSPAPS